MVESAMVLLVFAVLLAGIMELGFTTLISNSVSFAAQRTARFASVRGSGSGHPAQVSDIQAIAQGYAAPLNPGDLTVSVTWTPNNNPGSTVLVTVSYGIKMLPISSGTIMITGKALQTITQ
jgi:Flp pilus assembly protein TadG